MKFINDIKSFVGAYVQKKDLQRQSRVIKPIGFSCARQIGLLYMVPEEEEFRHITDFVKFLQDNGKTVKALGYINQDYIPHYCFPKLTYDYFTKKDRTWYGKPKHKFADDFFETQYDIMIDLTLRNNFTVNYIGYMSKASFKIGSMNPQNLKHYDLMMDVPDDIGLEKYITHLKHYMTQLNIKAHD